MGRPEGFMPVGQAGGEVDGGRGFVGVLFFVFVFVRCRLGKDGEAGG